MSDFSRSEKSSGAVGAKSSVGAPRFRSLVRRNLRANKRSRRPSWTPIEEPFVERAPEIVDVSQQSAPGLAED